MTSVPDVVNEHFDDSGLNPNVWFPHYLPHWSSRAASAATWFIGNDGLHLTIPAGQGLWCAEEHPEPLRVPCVQTGNFAGPRGSTAGQQPFRPGLIVREEQPTMWGYTPCYAEVEVEMRARIGLGSMFAFWLAGIEDMPERSGEICVAEVFGEGIRNEVASVGIGVHRFRDPDLREDFTTVALPLDVSEFHTYGVEWRPGSLVFRVDGSVVRQLDQAPTYPMQLMVGVFDFPAKAPAAGPVEVPELVVSRVAGHRLT